MRKAMFFALLITMPQAAAAQTQTEIDFVKDMFRPMQQDSFAKRREYCGVIGYDETGELVATEAAPGTIDSCDLTFPEDIAVIASYHTHGSFEIPYYNEMPSEIDMLSDQAMRVNGWIATPGGRLWYIDSRAMIARQICGVGCLPIAPGFYKAQAGDVAEEYSYDELVDRLGR
ncbi:uncharacterized protein DUF4329 [Pseudoroseicyclus aestuarii]|uniref:Uncharacterized protein DUF4329 n=2 Tax=Pseudoroseicyclus aestuarii TaxID=1795041 RepID=A0A318SST5_9RHOB|nr:uncharacterized protein DUF4329 [Pseudoroseicyclus aestuarii]